MNHRRTDAPVGYCPSCGVAVNPRRAAPGCSETQHAEARRRQSVFCVDCGTQLIVRR